MGMIWSHVIVPLPDRLCCLRTGIRQFHFNAWKDPNGTLASTPAGLKLAGITNVTLDPKYSYFGTGPAPCILHFDSC